jgi:hypothetical protein
VIMGRLRTWLVVIGLTCGFVGYFLPLFGGSSCAASILKAVWALSMTLGPWPSAWGRRLHVGVVLIMIVAAAFFVADLWRFHCFV